MVSHIISIMEKMKSMAALVCENMEKAQDIYRSGGTTETLVKEFLTMVTVCRCCCQRVQMH